MKKKFSLVFGILMLLLLCVPCAKAFAADSIAVDISTGETVSEFKTHTVATGSDAEFEKYALYGISVSAETKEAVFPITLANKGILACAIQPDKDNPATSTGELKFYADADCTKEIQYSSNVAYIPKKGTYYLKFTVTDSGTEIPADGYIFSLASQFYNSDDRTLKNNAWSCAGTYDSSKPIYYKVTAPKAGSLTINIDADYSSNVTLLSSSKKALSDKTYYYSSDKKICYAVGKGTYYLKVTGTSEIYRIKSTFKAISDVSGKTKAKAKKLSAGKNYTGAVIATDKKGAVDWYKITLPKSQKVFITFTGSVSSGDIQLELYGNGISGSIVKDITTVDSDKSFSAMTWTSEKLPKGTYYIKITKKTKTTSGYYNLKLK